MTKITKKRLFIPVFLLVTTFAVLFLSVQAQSAPDLKIMTNVTLKDSSIPAGTTQVSVSKFDARNGGGSNSGSFYVGYYLSADSTITSSDTLIGSYYVSGGIPAITTVEQQARTVAGLPSTLSPGTYYVGILLDRTNVVSELDESNNFKSTSLTVTAPPPTTYTLSAGLSYSGNGNGNITSSPSGINCGSTGSDCSQSYSSGTSVTLTANPASGSTFDGWDGHCSGTSTTCTVTMNSNKSVQAIFNTLDAHTLTVTKAGTGGGTVTSSPSGISSCGGTCTASYSSGTSVTLTRSVDSGSTFAGWSGHCSGTGSTCTVTMSSNKSVTATFNTTTTGSSDLYFSAPATLTISPTSVAPGGVVDLPAFTIRNGGNAAAGPFGLGYYLSADSTITSGDTLVAAFTISSLESLTNVDYPAQRVGIPAGTAPGNYYLGILLDLGNAVAESNENNNYKSAALTLTGTPPPPTGLSYIRALQSGDTFKLYAGPGVHLDADEAGKKITVGLDTRSLPDLSNCGNATTGKVWWDATAKRFVCGTDNTTTGDTNPTGGDNLGNHIATQTLKMQSNFIRFGEDGVGRGILESAGRLVIKSPGGNVSGGIDLGVPGDGPLKIYASGSYGSDGQVLTSGTGGNVLWSDTSIDLGNIELDVCEFDSGATDLEKTCTYSGTEVLPFCALSFVEAGDGSAPTNHNHIAANGSCQVLRDSSSGNWKVIAKRDSAKMSQGCSATCLWVN